MIGSAARSSNWFTFFDPEKKQIIKSINDGHLEQVSPNGKYLAYVYYDASGNKEFLGILDNNGNLINQFSLYLDGALQDYYNWQNSEKIRILAEAREHKLKVRLLDPITKDYVSLRTDWVDMYKPKILYC